MKKIKSLKKVWIILLCICVLFGYKKQIGISLFEHLSIKNYTVKGIQSGLIERENKSDSSGVSFVGYNALDDTPLVQQSRRSGRM